MSMTNTFETELLQHYFQNGSHGNIGNAGGMQPSSGAGNFFISLHTSDPGEAGSQTTNEADYTSYARGTGVRSSSGWTVSGNNASNTAAIGFPAATGGTNTISHFGIGFAGSGTGSLDFYGTVTTPLIVSNGVTPSFAIGELDVNAD